MTDLSILDRKALKRFETRMHQLTGKPFVDEDYAVVRVTRGVTRPLSNGGVSILIFVGAEKGEDFIESYARYEKGKNGIWSSDLIPTYTITHRDGEKWEYKFYDSKLPGHDLLNVTSPKGDDLFYKVTSTNRCDQIDEESFKVALRVSAQTNI